MKTFLAYATDPELRRNGSSGGFIRAMQIWMLETGVVDRVFHARTGLAGDSFFASPTYTSTDDPRALRGRDTCSVYFPVWHCVLSVDYLASYAATVLPCYMPEIRIHPEIVFTFELLCHHTPDWEWSRYVAEHLGVDCKTFCAYRGNGWPGELTMDDKTVPHTKYWSNDVQKWGLPKCKHCHRTHSPDTDFVCGDPWGYPGDMGDGKTMVRAQTEQAVELYTEAEAAGVIRTEPLDRAFWDKRIEEHGRR